MTVGLRVRDANGAVITSVTDRLSKIIDSVLIPKMNAIGGGSSLYRAPPEANGSISDQRLMEGAPYFMVVWEGQVSAWGMLYPQIEFSRETMRWVWPDRSVNAHRQSEGTSVGVVGGIRIFYGVYS